MAERKKAKKPQKTKGKIKRKKEKKRSQQEINQLLMADRRAKQRQKTASILIPWLREMNQDFRNLVDTPEDQRNDAQKDWHGEIMAILERKISANITFDNIRNEMLQEFDRIFAPLHRVDPRTIRDPQAEREKDITMMLNGLSRMIPMVRQFIRTLDNRMKLRKHIDDLLTVHQNRNEVWKMLDTDEGVADLLAECDFDPELPYSAKLILDVIEETNPDKKSEKIQTAIDNFMDHAIDIHKVQPVVMRVAYEVLGKTAEQLIASMKAILFRFLIVLLDLNVSPFHIAPVLEAAASKIALQFKVKGDDLRWTARVNLREVDVKLGEIQKEDQEIEIVLEEAEDDGQKESAQPDEDSSD